MTTGRSTAAVIGSGVAGLTAAHLLQRHYDVTLFEADDRLGGHAHTHEVPASDGSVARVDSGFIVHNLRLRAASSGTRRRRRGTARRRRGAPSARPTAPGAGAAARLPLLGEVSDEKRFDRHADEALAILQRAAA